LTPLNANGTADQPLCLNQEQLLVSREWIRRQSSALPSSLTPTALTLHGRLNYDALARTLNEIVSRHAALRVRIYPAPGMRASAREASLVAFGRGIYKPGLYRQSVVEDVSLSVREVDLTGMNRDAANEVLRTTLLEEVAHPFDYERPPLLRATLLKRGPEDHLLIVAVDHAVADAWSMRILRSELALLYEHFSAGTPYPLPDPGPNYPDYAAWQNKAMAGSHFARSAAYWSEQWARFGWARIATRELPFAAPEPQPAKVPFGVERAALEPGTCEEIRRFARQARVTLNMFFLTAYAILLHSYTRKAELALWGHFSNRGRPEFQNTIGYFVHSHLIGIDFNSDPSGAKLLQQVRGTVLDACDHQEMPLPYLWQRLNCWPRYADVRILLDYQGAPEKESARSANGLLIRRAKLPDFLMGRFSSLGVYVSTDNKRILVSTQYSRERFPQAPVQRLVEDLQLVIARLLSNPSQAVSAFFDHPRYPGSPVEPASEMSEFVVLESGLIPSLASLTRRSQTV